MELGTRELQSSLVRGSVAPAAAGLGDKRNLSFRAVRFHKTFSSSKLTRRSMILVLADPYLRGSDNLLALDFYSILGSIVPLFPMARIINMNGIL